ncbi:MAG: c-type cytochrome [Chloroflexota bacterium]
MKKVLAVTVVVMLIGVASVSGARQGRTGQTGLSEMDGLRPLQANEAGIIAAMEGGGMMGEGMAGEGMMGSGSSGQGVEGQRGEEVFRQRCAACHRGGGNILNPQKTLSRADREAQGLKTADDLVRYMRNPGRGMPVFSEDSLPESDARAVAEYIQKTFR